MYVKYARDLSGRRTTNLFIAFYLLLNLSVIIIPGYIGFSNPDLEIRLLIRYYLIALSTLFSILGTYYFLIPGKGTPLLPYRDLAPLAAVVPGLIILQNLILLAYDKHILLALLFILIYFLTGGLSPVYLKYQANLSKLNPTEKALPSFDQFCEMYKVSPREKEIIHEICRGLTNQEIADRLFISLQTVKDHTHRIYFKTDCSSRSQLIRKVNESL
ncbi:MAG: helix-turn-helix transcriptional regulator [Bacteroidales bacterium]|nr:helix-turn-helix transcriptional regulator [Bacteroidales bacterium]